jgi:hypothetical protein
VNPDRQPRPSGAHGWTAAFGRSISTNTTTVFRPSFVEFALSKVIALPSLEALRQHVLETLCAHDHLDPIQTPLFQAVVLRRGQPCGLFFQAQGPRLLKTYALWAGEECRVLFYDSTGERFAETQLSDAPDPLKLAA